MKKRAKIILGVFGISLLTGMVVYFSMITSNKAIAPKRVVNIPKTATWIGGVDGGAWFDIVSIDTIKKTYRFRIYQDYNGELIVDADFTKDTCNIVHPLDKSIINEINYFDFNETIMLIDYCKLKIIKPAYSK